MIRPACASVLLLLSFAVRPAAASDVCDGHARTDTRPHTVYKELFTYDTTADLGVQVVGTKTVGGATIKDITFVARPDRPTERVAAYIVAPVKGPASTAGVLWIHWLGEPATTNRTEFLDEATALAARGVVSVLIDTMWAKPRWYRDRVLEQDYATSIGQVVALRRGLDVLLAQRGVDKTRIALVGHDYGAMYGAIVAGVDGRAKTHVAIAATASLLDWAFFYGKKPVSMESYLREHEALSLCDHLAAAGAISFLFQVAEKDEYVTLPKATALFAAPTGRKQLMIYGGAGHEMTAPGTIRTDRTAWLVRELGL
jgi:dienelactone hydrolase